MKTLDDIPAKLRARIGTSVYVPARRVKLKGVRLTVPGFRAELIDIIWRQPYRKHGRWVAKLRTHSLTRYARVVDIPSLKSLLEDA